MRARAIWQKHSADIILLITGLVPGYVFAMAGWFGGAQVLFWVVAIFIGYAIFAAVSQAPLIWIADRISRRGHKAPDPTPKWNDGWRSALASFAGGLGIGMAVFFGRRVWATGGAP